MRKKKTFKSFICLLLCAVMTLGLFSSAFANDDIVYNDTDDIEVTDTVTDADVEESEALDADKEETGFENAIVALTADPDYGYGLYGGYDGQNSMNDPDTAGACVGWDDISNESLYADAGITTYSAMASSGLWWIDDYYVDAGSLYDVSVTDDFSLKYQVEFHTSQDIEAEAIEIVINASLGTYRDGTNILPNDIGVPYGTPDNYTESSASPFNYYYATLNEDGTVKDILTTSQASTCTETVYIVFWNYKDIVSGSNAMVQVLYKELDAMQIPDMTDWSLDIEATVSAEDVPEETVSGNTLTGVLDTSVTLNYVTKSAYYANNKSYTPELYTENQVSNYIDNAIPEPYASNFDDYIYLVWHVTIKGEGNQAYTIEITDNSGVDGDNAGSVVGWKLNSHSSGLSFTYDSDNDVYVSTGTYSTVENFSADMYVVTAYPAGSYDEGEVIDNYVDVTVSPYDGYDADISKEATDSVSWGEYEWNYVGDIIGIKKYGNGSYRPYLELYKQNQIDGVDTGSFKYTTTSTDRCFMLTHYVDMAQDGSLFGSWNGGYVTTTTVDDVLYACAGSDARQLDYNDYYFDSVTVTVKEVGYDVWEDEETKPNESDKIDDPDLHIYAMFPDNPGEWQYVNTVPYSSSGTITYTFSEDDIARQPYRIKAVVNCADYSVLTTIDTTVTLRYDSPIMAWYIDKYGDDLSTVSLENLSGVAGQTYNVPGYSNGYYFQDTNTDEFENYSEKDSVTGITLADWTRSTYDTILMRDNGYDNLTSLESTSAAYKAVETTNDTVNGRVLADYYLTAYEAYYVDGGTDTVNTLKEAGISLPDRSEVSFYDLLPYGVKYNGSVQPVAGYISNMNTSGTWRTNTGAWTSKDVTVTVSDDDVIDNWNGTGRTLVKFHLTYTGDDMTAYYSYGSMWYEGYGVYFQAYYDWEDINSVDAEYNIASYIVNYDAELDNELLGVKDSAVFKDDGSGATGNYAPFNVNDLNNDGITDKYTNMYCSATTNTNISTATSDSIKKLVRADTDVMAEYKTTAIVGEGKGYTYEISLTNTAASTMTDIVLFDKLEYAVEDGRVEVEEKNNPNSVFKDLNDDDINNHWTGTFNGLTLTALDDLGIDYTIYYNSNRNAVISNEEGTITPSDVLTTANGWYTADAYPNSIDTVKAIAVDLDGYELTAGESLSIQVHMIAPKESDYTYAFNNPAYYSVSEALAGGSETSATDIGDTVRVEIGETGTLTVTKQVNGDMPSSFSNSSFTFTVLRNGVPLANQEYIVNGFVYSTDVNGQFTLKDGQTAVFEDIVDVSDVEVIESESVYWERTNTSENRNGSYADYTFTNEYRSPAYFYKTVQTTDLASEDELTNAEFTFQIKVDTNGDGTYDSTYANGRVLYVDSVKTNGAEPNIIGETQTDANGYITLKIGDIIVFYPDGGNISTSYQVTETSTGESWICENNTVTGKTSAYGTSSTITNYYKYRALILTKTLNRYDGEDTFTFTFNITDNNDNALNGNRYYEINDNNEVINSSTITNGSFTMTDSNNRIVILDLLEGESYVITETNYDTDLFIPAQDDITVTMPIYSVTKSAEYTNTYRYADLQVQKIALSSTETDVDKEFEFTLTDADGNPVIGATYTIVGGDGTVYYTDSEGHFTVHGNETVYFDDLGHMGDKYTVTETADASFPQLSPSNGNGYDVTLDNDTVSVQFVNGDFDNIVSIQKDLVGKDELAESFVDFVYNCQYASGANDLYDLNSAEKKYSVDVTFGVYDDNDECVTSADGALIDYTNSNADYPYVYITIKLNTRGVATVTVQSYNGGEMTQTLYPYDTIYIAEIGDYTVKASESGEFYDGIFRVLGTNVGMWYQSYPDWVLFEPEVQSGSAVSGDSIVLVNNVYTADETSAIYKVMTDSSYEVPSGESIVFRVERYNAEIDTWTPAEGIKYIKMTGEISDSYYDGGTNTSGLLETGSDGIITLTKDDDGYPWIRFTEDTVYANVYTDANDGDLRIVELLDESDDDWGMLVGYDSADWIDGPALNVTPADTFVNGNDSDYVFDIEKTSETANEGDTFTFTLTQVTSAVTSPITSMSDVLDSTAGAYIDYVIYDSDTGRQIGEGQTDANGQFTLEANQYARFYVPEGTVWIVYEGLTPSYYIDSVTANEANDANVIDETEGLIGKETDAYTTATLILTLTDADGNPIEGGTFTLYCDDTIVQTDLVTDKNGQITVTVSETGNYYFEETSVPSGYDTPDNLKTNTVSVNKLLETYEFTMTNAKSVVTVNYAVRLYGICFDDTEDGSKASLTFGAAIGEGSLLDSYVSRDTVLAAGGTHNSTYCIHDMSWTEIIDICNTYKGNETQLKAIFGDCLDNGCTKAVPLTTDEDDNLFNSTTVNNAIAQGYTGDGVSTLYYLLDTHSWRTLYWNLDSSGSSSSDPANIYQRSRVRSTLTGDNSTIETQLATGGNNYYYSDDYPLFDESTCLFASFPTELQNAITPKAIVSDTDRRDDTTYDTLWLPSMHELGFSFSDDKTPDNAYIKTDGSTLFSSDSDRIAYEFNGTGASSSSARYYWSRSRYSYYYSNAYFVNTSGSYNDYHNVNNSIGLSPAFCIG